MCLQTLQVNHGSSIDGLVQTIVGTLEFGLPELKSHCLKTLRGGITAENACTTLITASSSLGNIADDESNVVREVEQCCVDYIEGNTRAVFKSKGFLHLPKETLLSIIQSSKVQRVVYIYCTPPSVGVYYECMHRDRTID